MPIFRLLIISAIIGIAIYFIRQLRPNKNTKKTISNKEIEETCRCAHCGLHFPKSEAITRDGKDYCCKEHADHPFAD